MPELYRDFFDIDPEYFPAVNASVIQRRPELWKKFYPHESFVGLLRNVVDVVNGRSRASIWVEGSYGTGKSHAVLTLKKLLDADEAETREYFAHYPDRLDHDLFNRFQAIKSGAPLLTVHRYGSADIQSENDLLFIVQERIAEALRERGFTNSGMATLRDAALKWLSDRANRNYFDTLMRESYANVFGGEGVEQLIDHLQNYSGNALTTLMEKMMGVADQRQIRALTLDKDVVIRWIKSVIRENGLKAIIFIWDEFTAFFRNNAQKLTTFQELVEMSQTDNFFMIPVTHDVTSMFPPEHKDWKQIRGRFLPFVVISLPDNMAFRLMGSAMEISPDPVLSQEWKEITNELYDRTREVRNVIRRKVGITDDELKGILPIHPYAALLLKYMASVYNSDVRSMFDFIKSDRGDELMGFQWFIDHKGPYNENPLLTLDMLWNFFYETGRDYLLPEVRRVLDNYSRATNLLDDEKRVFKAVLLMQAIYEATLSDNALLAPDEQNLDYAFEGSDMDAGMAVRIADSLVRKQLLFVRPGTSPRMFNAVMSAAAEIEPVESKLKDLVEQANLNSIVELPGALGLRYELHLVTDADFTGTINALRNGEKNYKLHAVIGFARNGSDAYKLSQLMSAAARDESYDVVFINATSAQLGDDRYGEIAKAKGHYSYWLSKDRNQAAQYNRTVQDLLRSWRDALKRGEFIVYSSLNRQGNRIPNPENLRMELERINRERYPLGLETFAGNATTTMWQATQLQNGAGLGAGERRQLGMFSCVPRDLGEAWTTTRYWEEFPLLPISNIKRHMDAFITEAFSRGDRISIGEIYDDLAKPPYGFMPCGQTAFILGFLLREYVDGSYSYSDETHSDKLDVARLKAMIGEYIQEKNAPVRNPRYKKKYIVKMTLEMKSFIRASLEAFGCNVTAARMEDIRDMHIRPAMGRMPFPFWSLKWAKEGTTFQNSPEDVDQLIDLYCAFANSGSSGNRSDSDIASDIGRLCMARDKLSADLHLLVNEPKSKLGMMNYLKEFEDGILPRLAAEIGDNGQYINRLKRRSSEAANWLWRRETVDQQIRALILDYQIVAASNAVISRNSSIEDCIESWISMCKNIKISYKYAKDYWEELSPLMEMLCAIKSAGELNDRKKPAFLELIRTKGKDFIAFYNHQEGIFKRACNYMLEELDEETVAGVLRALPGSDLLTMDTSSYQRRVKETIQMVVANQEGSKLRQAWRDATGTDSPKAWSQKYKMPILCMVDGQEQVEAKRAFDCLNALERSVMDQERIDHTAQFLNAHESLFAELADPEARDRAFREKILDRLSVLLTDIEEVKARLSRRVIAEPYDWYHLDSVRAELDSMAKYAYNGGGCERAMRMIDEMDVTQIKRYLKDLIEQNMTVGIEILRNTQ